MTGQLHLCNMATDPLAHYKLVKFYNESISTSVWWVQDIPISNFATQKLREIKYFSKCS